MEGLSDLTSNECYYTGERLRGMTGHLSKRVAQETTHSHTRGLLVALLALLFLGFGSQRADAQRVALKTNALHWAVMGSPNAALEVYLGPRVTLDLYGGANLWKLDEPREVRHWIAQPELRYWFCESFNGTFIGLHGHFGKYNIGGWDIPIGRLENLKDDRYEGRFWGAGLSLGHQWILSDRWNLEASLGGGWAHTPYKKYPCVTCGPLMEEGDYDYFGLTRATLSITYFFD
jgi:hypothetical protein